MSINVVATVEFTREEIEALARIIGHEFRDDEIERTVVQKIMAVLAVAEHGVTGIKVSVL